MAATSTRCRAEKLFAEQGIQVYRVLSERSYPTDFGNEEVVFDAGAMRLRVLKDRGQDFLTIGPVVEGEYLEFDDIELAFGWRTLEEILSKKEPEPLASVVATLAGHWSDLTDAFSSASYQETLRRVRAASQVRGEVFVKRLRQLAEGVRTRQ